MLVMRSSRIVVRVICRNFDQLGPFSLIRHFSDRWTTKAWVVVPWLRFSVLKTPGCKGLLRISILIMKAAYRIETNEGWISTAGGAIEHSKDVARRLPSRSTIRDRALSIVVVDELGRRGSREPVHRVHPR